jgi:hypothetical protein
MRIGRSASLQTSARDSQPAVEHVVADPLPATRRSLDLESLVGCTEDEARRQVETAGGIFRTYDRDNPALTLDLIPRRVTARTDAGKVVEVHGFG